jgi:23S rRNA C2498 (ribose-2'-O)-methylase RlmM
MHNSYFFISRDIEVNAIDHGLAQKSVICNGAVKYKMEKPPFMPKKK